MVLNVKAGETQENIHNTKSHLLLYSIIKNL
jgi:hypothetical protein